MNPENNTSWQYKPGQTVDPARAAAVPPDSNMPSANPTPPSSANGNASWSAAEFIEHKRGASWYLLLILATAAVTGGIYFLTKDYFAVATIVVVGVVVAILAGRKPKQVNYEISQTGLRIGDKNYNYNLFKSFSVMHEGQVSSINLLPVKRLMPPIAAYFTPQEEKRIVDAIGEHLPYEERKLEATDRLAHRLRF